MRSQSEIRDSITQNIIESLKQGTIPWRRPWRKNSPSYVAVPTNFASGRKYSGINIVILWMADLQNGFETSLWGTFQQWKDKNCQVKSGEKSTSIVFFKPIRKLEQDEDGNTNVKSFPILKSFSVFNISQVTGPLVDALNDATPQELTNQFDADKRAEFDRVVLATQARIEHGGNAALYRRPPADCIEMPGEGQFLNFACYAETLLHELCHWSEHRLNWAGSYAEGELRAEIGGCFLSAALGLPSGEDLSNHTAYLQSWLKALENDPKFIFSAAAAASKAADYILSFSQPKEVTSLGLVETV